MQKNKEINLSLHKTKCSRAFGYVVFASLNTFTGLGASVTESEELNPSFFIGFVTRVMVHSFALTNIFLEILVPCAVRFSFTILGNIFFLNSPCPSVVPK